MTSGVAMAFAERDHPVPKLDVKSDVHIAAPIAIGDDFPEPLPCDPIAMMNVVDNGQDVSALFINMLDLDDVRSKLSSSGPIEQRIGLSWVSFGIAISWTLFSQMYGAIIDQLVKGVALVNQKAARIARRETLFRMMNILCLGGLSKLGKILGYQNNCEYPVGLPTPAEAGSAWLANEIDDCLFQTYVQAGDMRFERYKPVVKSGKYKFTALDLMTLNKRGKIARGTLHSRMRELGSLHFEDQTELESLFTQIPGPSDLIRFMQRDVDNKDIVETFQLDSGFTDNFAGQSKVWAGMQGLTEDVMLREWRAHWSIPSPTQLYEMLHKLRHDPAFGGVAKVEGDVVKALKQQDILPYWIPRLMAVSYHSLTRTDLNRAYGHGWIDDDAYLNGMYKNGYSDDDAKTLLRFATNERGVSIRMLPAVKEYADGLISESQLTDIVTRQDWDPKIIPDIVKEANIERDIIRQKREVQAIARQYRACRITLKEAQADAERLGIPDDVLEYQLDIANLNTSCGTRHEYASTVCKALDEGVIDEQEYVRRMKELKFDETAITTYLAVCQNQIAARKAKQALAAQKAAQKEADKEARDAQRSARQAEQQANRIARLAAQMERRRQERNKALMSATNKLGTKLSDVSEPPAGLVDALFQMLQQQRNLSQDEAARVLGIAATSANGMTSQTFIDWVMRDAEVILAEPWSLFPPAP